VNDDHQTVTLQGHLQVDFGQQAGNFFKPTGKIGPLHPDIQGKDSIYTEPSGPLTVLFDIRLFPLYRMNGGRYCLAAEPQWCSEICSVPLPPLT
jgi:hypothetical protein